MHGLWVAAGFLTRIPVGDVSRGGTVEVDTAKAVPWFPTIGLLIGAFHGSTYFLAGQALESVVAAAIALAASLLLTGAFHYDGLADIADAFGGGWNVEQRMEILKDSRLGTYGVASLSMALIIEVAAVSQLSPATGFRALVVAHCLSRAAALAAMVLAPTAGDGMGASYMGRLSTPTVSLSVLVAIAISAAIAQSRVLLAVVAALVAAVVVVTLAIRNIGGVNGHVLGAVTVVSGLAILVIFGV